MMNTLPLRIDLTLARYQQVTQLTDADITARIAKLEQVDLRETPGYAPLDNGEIALALMDKYGIARQYEPYDFIGWSCWQDGGKNPCHITERQDWSSRTNGDFSLKKCICLAILLNSDPDFALPEKIILPKTGKTMTLNDLIEQFWINADQPSTGVALLEDFFKQNGITCRINTPLDLDAHYQYLQQVVLDNNAQLAFSEFLLHQPALFEQ